MNGLISLWTGTPMFRHRRSHLLVTTLAHCLAMESFGKVEFVTDFYGIELAERLGWRFTSILPALESLNDCKTKHIWALGKLVALLTQDKPVCQIDCDVYLHKPLPERILKAPLLAQSVDYPQWYEGINMQEAIKTAGLPEGHLAYNAGLLGGCDIPLIHDYATASLELAKRFEGVEDQMNEGTAISMVVEQYHLGVFARRKGVRVETLLPIHPTREEWHAAGYTHLHGAAKRDRYYLERTEERLKKQFPSHYSSFELGWHELQEDNG